MQPETILCVDNRVWHSLWRDSQQIMSRLSRDYRILYFEHGRNPDRPHSAEVVRNWPNFFKLRPERLNENLYLIPTPPCLPYLRRHLPGTVLRLTVPVVATVNAAILARHVRWTMREFAVQRPILWLYEPRHVALAGQFGEKLVCYFNYDEMSDFSANARIKDLLRDYDDRLTRRADVVFTTSRGQWRRRSRLNPSTYLTPNGVDFELFNSALLPSVAVPPELAALPKPVIGFAGWLGSQVDVDLLIHLAEDFPDASLALVGPDCLPEDERRRRLHSLRNVHFLGQKEVGQLPSYLKGFDVALIPYVIGGHTLTVYPLKLHEYLAAGRPVVATALPELRAFADVVAVAESFEEFSRATREAVRSHGDEAVESRVAVARANTWDSRVSDISQVLHRHLGLQSEVIREERVHRLDSEQPA